MIRITLENDDPSKCGHWTLRKSMKREPRGAEVKLLRPVAGYVCVCMYVCTYIYIYIYIYIHTHMHAYINNFSEIIAYYKYMSAQNILRLTDTRMSKFVYEYCRTIRRDVGRPKLRWRDKNPRVPKIPQTSYPVAAANAAVDDCTKTYTRLCSHLECNFTKYLLERQIFGSDV
jgi:hypothetical protein